MTTRILGIDPGVARCGWGVLAKEGTKVIAVAYDCIQTSKDISLPARLRFIYEVSSNLISKYRPQVMAVEELFFNTNEKTAFMVGQARGVVLLAAEINNLPVVSYSPLAVKVAVTGYGKAPKDQVAKMVLKILKLTKKPKPDDITDALSVALTHAFSSKMIF